MTAQILEIVTFSLNNNAAKEAFLEASEQVNNMLKTQHGFLYRSLCEDNNNQNWNDVVYWKDMDAAKAGGEALMQTQAGKDMLTMIDQTSVNMTHSTIYQSLCMEEASEA